MPFQCQNFKWHFLEVNENALIIAVRVTYKLRNVAYPGGDCWPVVVEWEQHLDIWRALNCTMHDTHQPPWSACSDWGSQVSALNPELISKDLFFKG